MAKTVLNTSIFNTNIDSHINTGTAAANEVLSYTGSDYDWVTQSGGVALTDFSVTTASAGTAALTYSNSTGVFTYTPPDLSSYLTAETNDLTSAVTWANVPNANITESSVTQHQSALSITESQISDLGTYLTSVALNDVSDVTITSASSGQVLKYNGTAWVNSADSGIALTDLSITTASAGTAALSYNNSTGAFTFTPPDLSSYLTAETNDLTSAVTWTNVPNANITESSVTQHQSALSITESQISDLGTYLTGITSENIGNLSDVTITTVTDNEVLAYDSTSSAWINQTAAEAGLATSSQGTLADSALQPADLSVTTNTAGTAALSYSNGVFTYTPPDLSSYLTGITGQSIENLSDVTTMTPTDGQVLTWDNTNSYWYAADASGGGSYSDSSVDTHLNTSTASANQVLSWTGSDYDWVAQSGGGGGASVTASDTAPSSPSAGDLWFNSSELVLYVYYNDGDSSQWVQSNPTGGGSSSSGGVTTGKAIAMAMIFGG
jgi:hypothetical protein